MGPPRTVPATASASITASGASAATAAAKACAPTAGSGASAKTARSVLEEAYCDDTALIPPCSVDNSVTILCGKYLRRDEGGDD